jgi:hypothetical protein
MAKAAYIKVMMRDEERKGPSGGGGIVINYNNN